MFPLKFLEIKKKNVVPQKLPKICFLLFSNNEIFGTIFLVSNSEHFFHLDELAS